MIDRGLSASSSRAINRVGQRIIVERVIGFAPNASVISVTVIAAIRGKAPDTVEPRRSGYSSSEPGSLSETEREFLVMAQDLDNAGFPLPLQRGDRITIVETGERMNVVRFDSGRRAIAGMIEVTAAGVS